MSIINSMLKNIERREPNSNNTNNMVGVNVTPVFDVYSFLFKVLVLLIFFVSIFTVYLYFLSENKTHDLPKKRLELTEHIQPAHKIINDHISASSHNLISEQGILATAKSNLAVSNIENLKSTKVKINEVTMPSMSTLTKSHDVFTLKDKKKHKATLFESTLTPKLVTKAKPANKKIKNAALKKSKAVLINEQFIAAKQAIEFGLYNEAIVDLNYILTQLPEHIAARSLLAATYFKQQNIISAHALLQAGIQQNPDLLVWRIMLSKILIMQQQYGDVLVLLNDDFDGQANLDFWVLKGTAAQSINKHKQALRCFKKLTQLQPSQAKWWLALATSKDALGDYIDAKQLYAIALDLGGLNSAMTQHVLQRLVALKEAV